MHYNGIVSYNQNKKCLIVEFKTLKTKWSLYNNYRNYRNGQNPLDEGVLKLALEWVKTFHDQGFAEPMDLPYKYDVKDNCLTVLSPNNYAKDLGWCPAETWNPDDPIPF